MTAPSLDELRPRLRAVRLLCLDVDGVMTDGHLYWAPGDVFWQRFNVRDAAQYLRKRTGDPFASLAKARQKLPGAAKAAQITGK